MRGFLRVALWSILTTGVILAVIVAAGYWLYRDVTQPGPLTAERTVIITARTGVAAIASRLAQAGVIRHPWSFELGAKVSGRGAELKAGEYAFPARISVMAAVDILASGKTVKHYLTIPDGLTSPEVVALVGAAPALAGDPGPVPPEGTLLPETYVYSYGDTRKALIERMRRAMAHALAVAWAKRRPDVPLTSPREALILGSLVVKESARPEERPHIAGVFLNRLRLGMPLQSDPTVIFALSHDGTTKLDRPLTHADLSVDSPYNTYRVKGLPPGPIDNPGKDALLAVLRPERSADLYFVADGTGGHAFARTLAGQDHNIALYQRGDVAAKPAKAPSAATAPGHRRSNPAAARRAAKLRRQAARERRCGRDRARDCAQ